MSHPLRVRILRLCGDNVLTNKQLADRLGVDHDHEALREMMTDPNTVLGLSDGGAHCGLICDVSMPTYLLTHWVNGRSRGPRLGLEQVVRKQTRETAEFYGFADRGLLAPGYLADVNVIDFDRLRCDAPTMAYDLPAGGRRLIQRAHGYASTVKRGVVVREDDSATGERPGRLLRGAQHACDGVADIPVAPGPTRRHRLLRTAHESAPRSS